MSYYWTEISVEFWTILDFEGKYHFHTAKKRHPSARMLKSVTLFSGGAAPKTMYAHYNTRDGGTMQHTHNNYLLAVIAAVHNGWRHVQRIVSDWATYATHLVLGVCMQAGQIKGSRTRRYCNPATTTKPQ